MKNMNMFLLHVASLSNEVGSVRDEVFKRVVDGVDCKDCIFSDVEISGRCCASEGILQISSQTSTTVIDVV
jgi:hypothetical protein